MTNDIVMAQVVERTVALFAACLVLQVVVWRYFAIAGQGMRLVAVFVVLPGIVCATPVEISWALTYLLHVCMSVCYIILYTGVTGFSPSIAILERVDRSMPEGLTREQLPPQWFTDTHLSGARRENLLSGGLITESGGTLRLTARGKFIAACFLIFRRFIGLPDVAQG